MSIREQLEGDLKQSMKSRNTTRLSCLRMLKARMFEREVELRAKEGKDYKITDEEALTVIASYAKQRRDSIEGFEKGGRTEQAATERAELEIVQEYLPKQLSEDEIREIVKGALAETGASGAKEMGAVMRVVMPKVKGLADGKLVQRIVRELLPA